MIDPKAMLAEVRENLAKLNTCERHDFHGIPERAMQCKDGLLYRDFRCSACGGKVSASDYRWYQSGFEHGAKKSEVTPVTNWRPMSSAPKDGTTVLLAAVRDGFTHIHFGIWDDQSCHRKPKPYWSMESPFGVASDRAAKLLGWMPLPDPPTEEVTP